LLNLFRILQDRIYLTLP